MGCRPQNAQITQPSATQVNSTLQIDATATWALNCNPGGANDPALCDVMLRAGLYHFPYGYNNDGILVAQRNIDTKQMECTSSFSKMSGTVFSVEQAGYYTVRFEVIDSQSLAVLTFQIAYVWVVPTGSGGSGT